ncbi:MAG: cytochrome C [Nitrospiraceae bacterium]|nr:MAG: cytochrome C [Nitrospiraceae bacterium]
MKTITAILAVLIAVVFVVGAAMAVPGGKTVEFAGGDQGKVTFDGKTHADKGNKCNDCHPKIFQMKKGSVKITKADHVPGKFCGTCHDGTKAFAQDEANCTKCHKK